MHDNILDPRDTYENVEDWNKKASKLARLFVANFDKYTDNEEGKSLVNVGPQVELALLDKM